MPDTMLPSARLPDFLRSELKAGEPGAFPLVAALDEVFRALSTQACLAAFDLSAGSASPELRTDVLSHLGLKTETLQPEERSRLFDERHRLLEARGFLSAAEILAAIYFPGATVRLGRPHGESRMGASASIRLAHRGDRAHTVFVRTDRDWPDARCREYERNVESLLPRPYRAIVALPKRIVPGPERACLSVPRRWENRRIECRISRR